MKNSKEYGVKLDKFYRAAKTGKKNKPFEFEDPIDALLYGIIAEYAMEKVAKKTFKSIQSYFVDYNDLRVCRPEEIEELLEDPNEKGEQIATNLTRALSKVFDKYDALSLKSLGESGKRQARKDLEDLEILSRFAIDFCFLTAFEGHAVPLNETMTAFLRSHELVDSEATPEEIESFLLRHIAASSAWDFYETLRQAAETGYKKADPKKKAEKKDSKKPASKKK